MKKIFLILGLMLVLGTANRSVADDLVFTPIPSCRIIDTRLIGVEGTMISTTTPMDFLVAGNEDLTAQGGSSTGCGIPVGTTAVAISFVAINPVGQGNFRA